MTVTSVRIEQDAVLLPLSSFVRDEANQVRLRMSDEAVERYQTMYAAEEPNGAPALPPVLVAELPSGVLLLVDGFHRVRAQERLGRTELLCTVIECADRFEAVWLGSARNTTHGVPLTQKERFRHFKTYVAAGQHFKAGVKRGTLADVKSYREMAKEMALSHTTIERWMRKAYPKLARELAARGQGQLERENASRLAPKVAVALTPTEECLRAIRNTRRQFKGVTNPDDRGEVLSEMQTTMEKMRESAPFSESDF